MRSFREIDAIQPAYERSVNLVCRRRPWYSVFAFIALMAIAKPGMELPSRLTRWFDVSEFDQYGASFVTLPTFTPIVRAAAIGLGIAAGLAFVILLLFALFRIPFIRFDLVSGKRSSLKESWRENGGLALQMFLFLLCLGIAQSCVSFTWDHLYRYVHIPDGLSSPLTLLGTGAWATTSILVYWSIDDFLVPVLSLEGGTITEAISQAWYLLLPDIAGLLRYLVAKLLLASVATFALTWFSYLECRFIAAPAARLAIRVLRNQATEGIVHINFAVVTVATMAVLIALLLLLLRAAIVSPISVFFGNYSVLFLAERYPALSALVAHRKAQWP